MAQHWGQDRGTREGTGLQKEGSITERSGSPCLRGCPSIRGQRESRALGGKQISAAPYLLGQGEM